MAKLTQKQEAFCLVYIETGNASEAYRRAYDVKKDTKEATINRTAKEIIDKPNIAARIAELRAPVIKRAQLSLESHLKELETLRELAKQDCKWNSAIQAEVSRGKASGLYVERTMHTFEDSAIPVAVNIVVDDASKRKG